MNRKLPLLLCMLFVCIIATPQTSPKPNIIFIVFDDMNDWVQGFDGSPQAETPNLDTLAQHGTLFYNANVTAPQCAPSRTSFLTGKDLTYTHVYINSDYKCNFRQNFTPANGNATVYTIPGYLKDSAGYFTYELNKIFHCDDKLETDYDDVTPDPCEKQYSWNRIFYYDDSIYIDPWSFDHFEGAQIAWARVPDSLEHYMQDVVAVDSAISFIDQVAGGEDVTCGGKPFFLGLGIKKPHTPWFIPEKYYNMDYYFTDIYALPFQLPYNVPYNEQPPNGLVMPPQPNPRWADYYALPPYGTMLVQGSEQQFADWQEGLSPQPVIDPEMTDDERIFAIQESKRANAVMAYMAAIKYCDAQIGRLIDSLKTHPAIYNNTVFVVISDHGWSQGEKKHWRKDALWETDLRIPFLIVDMRNPVKQVCMRTVSTFDIFPTLVDMLGLNPPKFDDGTNYLDGYSLMPLMANPNLPWERPTISAVEKKGNSLSCFPQYSIRSQRFQLIRYKGNNSMPGTTCNEALGPIQGELYEIGDNFETDPNEWHTLYYDPDYAPVVDYLSEFLPGGPLYLKKANITSITTGPVSCLSGATDVIKLKAKLLNPDGTPLGPPDLANYTFTWTNNLTADVYTGNTYNFHMSSVSPSLFDTESRIMFYLKVTDNASGDVVAFDMKYIYINPANQPYADYTVGVDGDVATIEDYSITGEYTSSEWNFGDYTDVKDSVPAPHTYASTGNYKIRNIVYYGNSATCRRVFAHSITIAAPPGMRTPDPGFSLYPNPASDYVELVSENLSKVTTLRIVDMLGKTVYALAPENVSGSLLVPTGDLPSGTYFMQLTGNDFTTQKEFEIVR